MSDDVTIGVRLDQTELDIGINEAMTKLDVLTKAARAARQKVLNEIRFASTALSSMLANYSQVMSLLGMQADAFYTALIGMTLSTVSMLVSIASALATTGVGIPASVVIMGVAVALNILTIGKLLADKVHTSGLWAQMQRVAQHGVYAFKHPAGTSTGVHPTGGGF